MLPSEMLRVHLAKCHSYDKLAIGEPYTIVSKLETALQDKRFPHVSRIQIRKGTICIPNEQVEFPKVLVLIRAKENEGNILARQPNTSHSGIAWRPLTGVDVKLTTDVGILTRIPILA